MLSALSVALMLLGSVVEVLDLSAVMLASLCTLFVFIRLGSRQAWLLYGVTSVLALLLLPSKTVALEYLLFGGYYPILRAAVARLGRIPALLITSGANPIRTAPRRLPIRTLVYRFAKSIPPGCPTAW